MLRKRLRRKLQEERNIKEIFHQIYNVHICILYMCIFQSVTINSKKAVNIPHQSNTKLTTKTNVIVIQKGNAKGITLSHAGKVFRYIRFFECKGESKLRDKSCV